MIVNRGHHSHHPRGTFLARLGGTPRHQGTWEVRPASQALLWPIFIFHSENPRTAEAFSRIDSDLCHHRRQASGVTTILFWHPARGGPWPLGPSPSTLLHPWCVLSSSRLDYGFMEVACWYSLPLILNTLISWAALHDWDPLDVIGVVFVGIRWIVTLFNPKKNMNYCWCNLLFLHACY